VPAVFLDRGFFMRFAYSSTIFRSRPLFEALEGIAKAGFTAVELMADRPHAFPRDLTASKVAELNEYLEQRKLRVSNLNSCVVTSVGEKHNPSWISVDWNEREERIQYTLECLRMAAVMAIPSVSIDSGAMPAHEAMNQKDILDLFMGSMNRLLPLAEKLGVKILIQPESHTLLETTEQTLEFLKELPPSSALRIDFDAGHCFRMGEDPCHSWDTLKAYVAHVHLDDISSDSAHRHIQLGEGVMNIPGFLGCLQRDGYEGYVTIKLDRSEQRAEEVVLASARYLREKGFLEGRTESGE
jgi:sugar phosphate isomerase/epimerase